MTFVESLRHCLTVKYCSVRGRASRSEYWWFMLFSSVSTAVLENIPVVGMGGVSSAEDVIEMMLAGATAVEVGAANLVNPFVCKQIIEDLPAVMDKYRINTLSEIIGGVK